MCRGLFQPRNRAGEQGRENRDGAQRKRAAISLQAVSFRIRPFIGSRLIAVPALLSVAIFWDSSLPFLKAVEDELNPCGHAELVKYPEQIVADRVLAEPKLFGDFPV